MHRWTSATLCILVVGAGFGLRLWPCLREPNFEFVIDSAVHERLTREVLASGSVTPVDSLSEAPLGRRTAAQLPLGLYTVAAGFQEGAAAFGAHDLRWNLAIFTALAGALCVVPAWLGAATVYRLPFAGALAALVLAFLPAHLARTNGLAFRYDATGTLLNALQIALALAALGMGDPRRRRVLASLAGLAFVVAMTLWRVSLLVLELETLFVAAVFVVRGGDHRLRDLWIAIAVLGTIGLAPVPYLAAHGFLRSLPWIAVLGLAALLAIPALAARRRWPARLAGIAVVGALAMMLGRGAGARDYAGITGMLGQRLGLVSTFDPNAALMRTVLELQSMSPVRLLASAQVFSWLGVLVLASPLLFAWLRASRAGARPAKVPLARKAPAAGKAAAARPTPQDSESGLLATALLAWLVAGLAAATLLFQRSAVLLAPVLAMTVGGLGARAIAALATPSRRVAALVTTGLTAAAVALTLVAGVRTAATETTRIAPNLRAAIEFIRTHSDRAAVVLTDWDTGYDVQTLADRPTAVDGLLESPENRRRILALYAACMDTSAAPLEALCRRLGARWLLLPPASAIYAMASVSDDPLAAAIASGRPVPRGPLTDHLIVHLIDGDREYPALRRVLESGGYTVFEVGPEAAPLAAAQPAPAAGR